MGTSRKTELSLCSVEKQKDLFGGYPIVDISNERFLDSETTHVVADHFSEVIR